MYTCTQEVNLGYPGSGYTKTRN